MAKILVIEDSPEVRERIVASLTFEGFEVVEAADGEAGIRLARALEPDLILCDIMMPRIDGHATLSELRKHNSTAGIPFIFLSAKSQVGDMREGLRLGADDYLVKPFSVIELSDAVKLRLRRRREMAAARAVVGDEGRSPDTGAPADFRAGLDAALGRGRADGVRVALLMLQTIGAERVRRALGGAFLASVMAEAGGRLSRTEDSGLETVFPLGEGKFAAILTGNRLPMAADEVCERLFSCLSRPFERGGAGINLAAAIGIALYPTHGADADVLVARAEAALDAALRKGENGYRFYTTDLESRAARRHDRTASLYRAFRAGDFEMRYRVEVECRTERPAVLRCVPTWRHPERGMVPVSDYEPLVEEAGLLDKFFDWSVREVCRQKAAWLERAWGNLTFALDIAAPQLLDLRLVPTLARALDEFGLEGKQFELHFSKDLSRTDPAGLAPLLQALKGLGPRLTVDGFSVGAQVLENWRGLPLDNLSLEGGFLNRAPTHHEDRLLLTALISLAHGIGLKVNASAIDSEALFALLRRLLCDGICRYRNETALAPRKIEGLLRRGGLF